MHYLAGTSLQALFCRNSFACTELHAGYWGYGNEYQKDDNLEAYKAVVGNGISFIDTSEVRDAFACHLFSPCMPLGNVSITPFQHGNCQAGTVKCNAVLE